MSQLPHRHVSGLLWRTIPLREEYAARIRDAEMILGGKSEELVCELESEMQKASDELRFEQAVVLRNRLRAIQGLSNRQRVIGAVTADADAVGFFRGAKSCFAVLHYVGGDLAAKDYDLIDEPSGERRGGSFRYDSAILLYTGESGRKRYFCHLRSTIWTILHRCSPKLRDTKFPLRCHSAVKSAL